MLLGGLWHGAGWQFVLWGGLHGLFLIIAYLWKFTNINLNKQLSITLTFLCVVFAWVPFRANTLNDAVMIWKSMLGFVRTDSPLIITNIINDITSSNDIASSVYFTGWEIFALFSLTYFVMTANNIHQYLELFKPNFRNLFYLSSMAILSIAIMGRTQSFIYYSF
jgi:alginate O-acetyltransferase complex protein AlgI